ncbi:MAG: tRNA (N6-threonylcarbamoyladenosine(37)-N6)-methyltransferase TrmO [Bacteroidales bacterium]|nr:tRNA (N6-threonylcarbamoyladenosine(37)-N6)-methyltransferase TrmO [Bacteroidales bacterium]
MQIEPIAHIESDFQTKFGVPRQSGLAPALRSRVVFEPRFRNDEALRGLDTFSYIWLIWGFSETERAEWSPTVRPPRLGGNKRVGVFASRSPFRPNSLALSSVRLVAVEPLPDKGMTLVVAGADLMDGTPIYDIKPYIAYTDSHPDARCGFTDEVSKPVVDVVIPEKFNGLLSPDKMEALHQVLALNPVPAYHNEPDRVYGFTFSGVEVKFFIANGVLTVAEIAENQDNIK